MQERTAELRESEARYRSLTELASDWYWEQDENGNFTKVSGPVLEMLGIRVDPLVGDARAMPAAAAGTRRSARRCRQRSPHRQPFLDFVFSRVNADGSQQTVPGERRADVQPVLPLHRLPRHRRRAHGQVTVAIKASAAAMPFTPTSPNQNHLLAALPDGGVRAPGCRIWSWCPLPLGEMLYEPGGQLQHAYFPTTAIVSLHYVMESGASAESAGVGNEGVVGISLFMGGDTTPSSAVVQTAGHAYRLPAACCKQEFDRARACCSACCCATPRR